ncbi:hypothetical protein [Thermococcus peptonophilus]|uniref:Uncharacterized protein n=1 Tax=Thermococcus peptonophilus TaxID=53952 RepID=A0A142CTX5_9EURY|nr:hypothetical protein [Thermococcus peptonophilus]AMQ18227.1 hypothetical protein A0127_03110 [Thermococcus peptonophilus]
MSLLSSLLLISISGAVYYWLISRAIEGYREAWIDNRSFGIRVLVYTAIYYLMAIYAIMVD